MTDFEKKKLEFEFNRFARKNFERPGNCKNIDQIRFYVNELTLKIEEFKSSFDYVPDAAYTLLSQYNRLQNQMIFAEFKNTY